MQAIGMRAAAAPMVAPAARVGPPKADDRVGAAGHVWLRDVSPGADLAAHTAVLDEDERRRAAAYLRPADRHAYVTAHALLRTALSWARPSVRPADWRFVRDEHDKPELAGPCTDLRFSLSHCACRVAVAVSTVACGVDVECGERDGDLDLLVRTVLSPAERAALAALADPARQRHYFFRIWTVKECYAKARGLGLRLPFDALDVRLDPVSLVDATPDAGPAGRWQFAQWCDGTHPLAVAFRSEMGTKISIVVHSGRRGISAEPLDPAHRGEIA